VANVLAKSVRNCAPLAYGRFTIVRNAARNVLGRRAGSVAGLRIAPLLWHKHAGRNERGHALGGGGFHLTNVVAQYELLRLPQR
jgi:hypothetical protein